MNPLEPKPDDPEWLRIARTFKGIRETIGGKLNPIIAKFFEATHFPISKLTPTTPWCAAMACWCMREAGVPHPTSASAAALATFGYACKPRPGALVVLAPGVLGAGISGHAGFWEQPLTAADFWLYSGNCMNTARSSVYPISRVVAYRWPFEELAAA